MFFILDSLPGRRLEVAFPTFLTISITIVGNLYSMVPSPVSGNIKSHLLFLAGKKAICLSQFPFILQIKDPVITCKCYFCRAKSDQKC